MNFPRNALSLLITLFVLTPGVLAQGVPLDALLRDGLKKPGAAGAPQQAPPDSPQSPGNQAPPAQRPPAGGVSPAPASQAAPGNLPFDVRLPQGWRAQLTEESGMLARSPNQDAVVAVLPIVKLGNLNAAQWLQRNAAGYLSRFLPRASVAAVYPSRMGVGGALASLEFDSAGRPGKSSVLLFTHAGMGTLYVIGASAQQFDASRAALLSILRSFSFRGERAESPAPQAASQAAAALSWRKFQDPAEQAFTVDVPSNWKVEGGLVRKSTVDVSTYIRVISPEGVVVVLGDSNLQKYVIPTQTLEWTGFREGSQYSPFPGNVMIVSRYLPGAAYAQMHAARVAQAYGLADFRMGQPRARTDVDQNIPSIGTQIRGGEVDFTALSNQRPTEGYVMAATSVMTMQGVEGGIWNVQILITYLAPRGMSATARAVVSRMMATIQLNPQWVRQQRQMTEQTYRAVRETNEYISKLFRETFEERQRIQDRQNREFGDVIRGVVRLRDPESGEVLEGRAGNNYYWRVRHTDTLIGSDLPHPPPNVDVTELEQVR